MKRFFARLAFVAVIAALVIVTFLIPVHASNVRGGATISLAELIGWTLLYGGLVGAAIGACVGVGMLLAWLWKAGWR